jgi:hypothetical protein
MTPAESLTLELRDGHQYWYAGKRLHAVTEVLDKVLRINSNWWLPKHRLRGQWVHSITQAIDDHDYDESLVELPEQWPDGKALTEEDRHKILARGKAYQRWKDHTGFEPSYQELPVCSLHLGIAGTLDRIGRFAKGKYKNRIAVVELKSGTPTAAARLQVALYRYLSIAWAMKLGTDQDCITAVVQLCENGKPVPDYRDGSDLLSDTTTSLSVVQVFHFMKEHALL